MSGRLKYVTDALMLMNLYIPNKSRDFKTRMKLSVWGFLNFCSWLILLVQFFYIRDFFDFVNNLEGFSSYSQVTIKLFVLIWKKHHFADVIDMSNDLWKTSKSSKDKKIQLDGLLKIAENFQKVFLIAIGPTAAIIAVYWSMQGEPIFAVSSFLGNNFLVQVSKIIQIPLFSLNAFFLWAFDCFFLACCFQITVQFRILSDCFSGVNFEHIQPGLNEVVSLQDVKSYIKYHNFLLRFLVSLQKFYSPIFFIQCITTVPLVCVELYVMLESTDTEIILKGIIECSCLVLQLALYCLPAELVTDAALSVAHGVYDCKWYSVHYDDTKMLKLIIQKSQQPFIFTAAGLFELRARTVLNVLKMSWSVYAVISAMKK